VNHPPVPRSQPSAADDEVEVVYKKHPEQVAQERWVAMMKRDQLRRAELAREKVPHRPAPRKQPEPAEQTEPQPTKKKFKPAATITFDQKK
jgi:creatinine amidohydrolase/Fe(II)-dependent formamide hydrolase-like protein